LWVFITDIIKKKKKTYGNLLLLLCIAGFPYLMRPSWSWSYGSWIIIYNYLCNRCLSPLMLWVRLPLRVRSTTLRDKVCQWLASGRWFSPSPPVSSTNKTDHHDITEILLKVALSTIKPKQTILDGAVVIV
jgi:hypothetical protein